MQPDLKITAMIGMAALCCNQSSAQNGQQRPNIIYIMSDDHAYQAISAYGSALKELAATPNIDRIARASEDLRLGQDDRRGNLYNL